MMYLQLQILLIMCVSAINGMNSGPKASVGEFKYIASIWKRRKPLCAGIIIHKRYVLTAAHCVFKETPFDLHVLAGLIDLRDPNSIVRNVKTIHPYYATEQIPLERPGLFYFKNDITILEIEIEFSWSATIGPIPISEAEQWDPCEPCLVPGWHWSKKAGITDVEFYLTSVYGNVLDDEICHKSVDMLLLNERCAYDDFGRAIASHGDSGAPVICRGLAAGIIVRGYEQQNKPTIILSTYPYREFIYQTIHDDMEDVNLQEFPYVVSIWSNTDYISGGIIFNDLHVITMAHRITDLKKDDLRVLSGKRVIPGHYLRTDWSYVDRADLYLHYQPDYEGFAQNNIAVLKLKQPLLWTPVINEALLSIEVDLLPGQRCQVLQWSRKNEWWGAITRKLVWVPAVIRSERRCEELGISIGSNEFCATSEYEFPLAFEEDSGNPMVCQGIVVGILANVPRTFSLFARSQAKFIRLFPYVGTIQAASEQI